MCVKAVDMLEGPDVDLKLIGIKKVTGGSVTIVSHRRRGLQRLSLTPAEGRPKFPTRRFCA